MKKRLRLVAILAALVPIAGGCNSILGIESHALAPDGGGAGGGSNQTDGGGAGGGSNQTDGGGAGGTDAAVATTCGFTMPNPADAGLPNPASYTPNVAEGTVTDNVTHLIWERKIDETVADQAGAVRRCEGKGGGWRLPTRVELTSLVDFTIPAPGPTINAIFDKTPPQIFWTSSHRAFNQPFGWAVFFGPASGLSAGSTHQISNTAIDTFLVRCVRGGSFNCSPPRFQVQEDGSVAGGSVLDRATGLIWQRTVAQEQQTWDAATTSCLNIPGGGWRLPSLTELQTIVDETKEFDSVLKTGAAIDGDAFPGTPGVPFWTSSRQAGVSGFAWFVTFFHGHSEVNPIGTKFFVRCVR